MQTIPRQLDYVDKLLAGSTDCDQYINNLLIIFHCDDDKRDLINRCISGGYAKIGDLFEQFIDMLEDEDDTHEDYRSAVLLEWWRDQCHNPHATFSNVSRLHGNEFRIDSEEYLVVTYDEANNLLEAHLDDCLDGYVLHGLAEHNRMYFDRERWKRDARADGRGHHLNRYDGDEHENRNMQIYRLV